MPRVLIVEGEPMVAMDLESTVKEIIAAEIVVAPSVSSARAAMAEPLDFAFLDIEVADGKTFEIALELRRNEVPFVFVSGARPEALPPDLRGAPFIPKPFERHLIARVLRPRSDQSAFRPPDPRERSTSQARAARRAGAGFSATVRAAIRRRSSMTTDPKRD